MTDSSVQVALSLLQHPTLSPHVKVLAIARRNDPGASPTTLAHRTGLSRAAVYEGLTLLKHAQPSFTGRRVSLPLALLSERSVGPAAKLLYGLLQAIPGSQGQTGQFTFASLGQFAGLQANTVRRAVTQLVAGGWIQTRQANRRRPIEFTIGDPHLFHIHEELLAAERRLNRARRDGHGGEGLMQEYLTLLIDSTEFTKNARPGFLVNPQTGDRLELDRYYPPKVAFEFNGAQHYRATGRFTQADADAQRIKDLFKAGLCLYAGVDLVIVHAEDLSLQGMLEKIGRRLPLRDLTGYDALIDLLERASLLYQAAERVGAPSGKRAPTEPHAKAPI